MRKTGKAKTALTLALVAALSVSSAGRASAKAYDADYSFRIAPYDDFYEPANTKIIHDGHGDFSVRDTPRTITSEDGYTTVIYPDGSASSNYPDYPAMWQSSGYPYIATGHFSSGGDYTEAGEMLYGDGSLGAISFMGQSVRVYEGESLSNLLKGAGHFSGTSAWEGNVVLAGHNRGPNAHFYYVKDLREGDLITYTSCYGARSYRVTSTRRISSDDFSPLDASYGNQLTLITCVANQPSLRLCVQAVEV